jgi:prolyl-tRNA editing enzyme YbaK/EbsC (Cys-tRNA(Pro) deacylase)
MQKPISNSERIKKILEEKNLKNRIVELPSSTKTSKEAAEAVDCKIQEIAKAIVFKKTESKEPVLVLASGSNRVSENKISDLCGEKIEKADADFVKNETGFSIGAVSPMGHKKEIQIFIDEDLLKYEEIWGAAGTQYSIFKMSPKELLELSKGTVADVKED